MDFDHGLLMAFIGIPFSVAVLYGIIQFIGITEKEEKDENSEDKF